MILFPIGTLSGGTGTGSVESVLYSFFEPNKGCTSVPVHTILTTRFNTQTLLARKKADPYLTISYEYENIYNNEFVQLEHFINSIDEGNTPIHICDLSKGTVPTAINTSSTWIASINNTRLYSATTNFKANYVFFWNGANWRIGDISSVSANTSITCDVDTNNFGLLSDANGAIVTGNSRVWIYPIFECYVVSGSINNFKVSGFWDVKDSNRGPMWSGTVNLTSRYKIG